MSTPNRKRRIMREFSITELSAVDKPAQEYATMAIMKRDSSEDEKMDFQKITDKPLAFDSFENAVEHLKKVNRCSGTEAMRKAADAHPRLFEAYQEAGMVSSRPKLEKAAKPQAVQEFNLIVDGIAKRDKVSRVEAMRRATREEPGAFRRYQAA